MKVRMVRFQPRTTSVCAEERAIRLQRERQVLGFLLAGILAFAGLCSQW